MFLDKCLALVFSLMILGQAYVVRRFVGTWLFPACIFGLFWFGYTFVPLAILFWVPVQPYATLYIFLCTLAFSMGSLLFDWKTAFQRNAEKRETARVVYGSRFLKTVLYVSTVASLFFFVVNSFAQGFSLHDLVFDLMSSATAYAEMRYSETLNINIFGQLSFLCGFISAIIGGFIFSSVPTRMDRWRTVVLSFLPIMLIVITQSVKWVLFLCIALFFGSLLAYRVSAGTLRLFEKGAFKTLAYSAAILIPITVFSFLSRKELAGADDADFIVNRLVWFFTSYICTHIYAFSDWFSFVLGGHSSMTYTRQGSTYGFYTFMSLFRLMGDHRAVPLGLYDEYYSYGDVMVGNIYTMFRGLVQDFGVLGSLVFMSSSSLLFHSAFHGMLRNRKPVFTTTVFVFMVGYCFSSFGNSLLSSTSIYVAFLVIWLVLWINKRITQTSDRRLLSSQSASNAGYITGLRISSSGE
jgi:oligosaccharide repeat unit polymerase